MSSAAHTFTRVSFRMDIRVDIADKYSGALRVPSPSMLAVPPTTPSSSSTTTTWGDLFHPTAASVQKMNSGAGTLSYPKVHLSQGELGSYRFVEDLFAELKAHFPKRVLQRCTLDGPALLQLPFYRHGEDTSSKMAEVEEEGGEGLLVSTVESSVRATQSSTFAIPIEITHLPQLVLGSSTSSSPSTGDADENSKSNSSGEPSTIALRVTVLDTRLASALASALANYHFIALGVGRLVKLSETIVASMRRFEASRRVAASRSDTNTDMDDASHLAASRKEGDAAPNPSHFNVDDDLWDMLREDPVTAGAEDKDKCFTPFSSSAAGDVVGGAQVVPIGSKRSMRSNEHPTSVTEAVLYQQLDDDTNRKDLDLDAQHLQQQQLRDSQQSEHPPQGKSYPLSQVSTLYQLGKWVETHVEYVGVLSANGEHASSFAFAMKRLIQLKVTVPQLLAPLEDEQASPANSAPSGSASSKLGYSFANHSCHYVRAVALMYGRYVLPLEEFLLLVLPQTKDVGGLRGQQDESLSCSPDGNSTMTVRELCEALLLRDEVCEAFTPLYEYEILTSVKGRVLRLSADVRQRERDLEELTRRRKEQQEASLRAKVHRGGVVGGLKSSSSKAEVAEGGDGVGGGMAVGSRAPQASGSLSAAGFTSIKDLSDFLRREARLANAREAHVVGFEDGELDIESDGEDVDVKDAASKRDVFNLPSASSSKFAESSSASTSGGSKSAVDREALARAKKQQEATRQKARAAAYKNTLSFTSSFTAQAQSVLMPLLGLAEAQRADDPMFLQFGAPYYSSSSKASTL